MSASGGGVWRNRLAACASSVENAVRADGISGASSKNMLAAQVRRELEFNKDDTTERSEAGPLSSFNKVRSRVYMIRIQRLTAAGAILAIGAIITCSTVWGEPGRDRESKLEAKKPKTITPVVEKGGVRPGTGKESVRRHPGDRLREAWW